MSLFKQHPSVLDETQPTVKRAMRYWESAEEAGGELFRFYANVRDGSAEWGPARDRAAPTPVRNACRVDCA